MVNLETKLNFLQIPNLGKNVKITVASDGLIMHYTLPCSSEVTGCFSCKTTKGKIRYYYSRKVLIRYGPKLVERLNTAYYFLKHRTRAILLSYKLNNIQKELTQALTNQSFYRNV